MSITTEVIRTIEARLKELDVEISQSARWIVDNTMQADEKGYQYFRKDKLEYGKTQLQNCLLLVKDIAATDEEWTMQMLEMDEHKQELMEAINEADFEVLRAESTDGKKGNLYLSPIKGSREIPVTTFNMKLPQPYVEILARRGEQDGQWGGEDHDDGHIPYDWIRFIEKQLKQLKGGSVTRADFRERMLDVAALAVAAIESYDRKTAEQAIESESKEPKKSFEAKSSETSYVD